MRMRTKKGIASYKKAQVNTSNPGQRVVLLYDGILKFLKEAKTGFEIDTPDRFEMIHSGIIQAEKVIFELQQALDMENGGEVAKSLYDLYEFWIQHLSQANVKKIQAPLDEVIQMVTEVRDSWVKAVSEMRQQGS